MTAIDWAVYFKPLGESDRAKQTDDSGDKKDQRYNVLPKIIHIQPSRFNPKEFSFRSSEI